MAASYGLVEQPVQRAQSTAQRPLQRLYEELKAFAGEREGWELQFFTDSSGEGEEEEEGQIPGTDGAINDIDGNEEEMGRHEALSSSKASRRFPFEYIQVIPSLDTYLGALFLLHALPGDASSPLLLQSSAPLLPTALPLDATMALTVGLPEGAQPGVAYKWIQVIAGMERDVAFADGQRCLTAFFTALANGDGDGADAQLKDDITEDASVEITQTQSMDIS